MIKVGASLKETFDNLRHVTSLAHALHRVVEFVRSQHLIADDFIPLIKKLLVKHDSQKSLFQSVTELTLPRHSITTRWGTWL